MRIHGNWDAERQKFPLLLNMTNLLYVIHRAARDESGQDLIEFGLLASIIAIAGVLVFPLIEARMGDVFTGWETPVYDLWIPDDPATP